MLNTIRLVIGRLLRLKPAQPVAHHAKRPVACDTTLIAACGLYCGACKGYLTGRCPGCRYLDQGRPVRPYVLGGGQRCAIRRCCQQHSYHSCAQCRQAVTDCKRHNTLLSRLFGLLFNSDRAACIRYIRVYGRQAYAELMCWAEQMTMRHR